MRVVCQGQGVDMTTSTQYKQVDWTGEQGGLNPSLDLCPVCSSPLPFSFGSGRPAEYCSNACKMKAYRRRNKQALRNYSPVDDIPCFDSIASPYSRSGWFNLYGGQTNFEYNPFVSIRQATNPQCSERNPLYSVFRHIDDGRIVVYSKGRQITKQRFPDYETAFYYVEQLVGSL